MPLHTITPNTNVDPHLLSNPRNKTLSKIIRQHKLARLSADPKYQELLNIDHPNNKIAIPDDYYSENYDVTYDWPSIVKKEQKQISKTYTLTLDDLTLLIKQNPKHNEQSPTKISIDELQFQELLFITTDNDKTMCLTPHGLYLYSIYHLLMVQLLNSPNVKQDFIEKSVMGTIIKLSQEFSSNNPTLPYIPDHLKKISSNNNGPENQGGKNTTSNSKYSREQRSSYEDKSSPKHSRVPMLLRKFAKQGKLGSRKLRLTSNTKNSILTRKKQKRILGGNSLGDFLGHLSNAGFRLFMRTLTCSTIRVMNIEEGQNTTRQDSSTAPFTPIIPHTLYRNRGIAPEVVQEVGRQINPGAPRSNQVVPDTNNTASPDQGALVPETPETKNDADEKPNDNSIPVAIAEFVEPTIGFYVSTNNDNAENNVNAVAIAVNGINPQTDTSKGLTFAVNIQRMKNTIEIYSHIYKKLFEFYKDKYTVANTETIQKKEDTEYLLGYLRKKIVILTKFYTEKLQHLIIGHDGELVTPSPGTTPQPTSSRSVDILKIFSRIVSTVNELIIILELSSDDYITLTASVATAVSI